MSSSMAAVSPQSLSSCRESALSGPLSLPRTCRISRFNPSSLRRGSCRVQAIAPSPVSVTAPSMSKLNDFDPSSMLLRQRIIFLGSQVDDFSADVIISQLLLLDAEDSTKDIKLFINSPGGSVTAGMGIYDAIKLCKADVSTVCFGLAASMGAFLLASGTRGKRYCMPNARVMIHQPLGGASGSAIEVGLQVREMMYHKVKLTKIMSRLTGKTEEQIEIDTDRDFFMNAWEARDYGLVDGVIDDGKPGLVAPIGEAKEPPKTKVWEYWTVRDAKERKTLPTETNAGETKAEDEKQPDTETKEEAAAV
ncbi:hypothetical protein GOP47_0008742 [Adiantum capillus-veneris]|uniref:ATP-dependent Clp protease proteolytic subunit n=1 Tax=Adiantum capillus-veneris TaxID=13818 RepID=A0A9D4V0E5_ADICA|nr:hypothetical protein GOP47_0008742 [Adiantum capillus-veneris]